MSTSRPLKTSLSLTISGWFLAMAVMSDTCYPPPTSPILRYSQYTISTLWVSTFIHSIFTLKVVSLFFISGLFNIQLLLSASIQIIVQIYLRRLYTHIVAVVTIWVRPKNISWLKIALVFHFHTLGYSWFTYNTFTGLKSLKNIKFI